MVRLYVSLSSYLALIAAFSVISRTLVASLVRVSSGSLVT